MQSQSLRQLPERVAPLAPEVGPQISIRASDRPTDVRADQLAKHRPSIGRRMFRAFARFCIAVSIGVSATLAWQLHGDKAEKIVGAWIPSLSRFLPIIPSGQFPLPQSAATAQISAPATTLSSSEMTTQLKTMANEIADAQRSLGQLTDMAGDVADTRRNVEQLAARQEQIAQSIATLQKFEQEVKQRLASAPQSRSVPLPPRKPQLPAAEPSGVQTSSAPPAPASTQQPPPSR